MKARLTIWTTPSCYFGFDPVGHVLVASKHRESSVLDESNYAVTCQRLMKAAGVESIPALEDIANDGPFSRPDPDNTPVLYTWCASSSLVGWIAYLMIRPCREAKTLLAEARAIAHDISQYPVLDENDYSERQRDGAMEWWQRETLGYRVELCREHDESIFAARRSSPPDRVFDWLCEEVFA